MKKIISCLVAVCMAAMSFVTVHCEDNIKVILDGKTLEFDVQPQIIDERTLVPMRVIFEALGADVEWEEETQTINARRSDTDLFYISMRVGDKTIHKESVKANLPTSNDIELDVPPMIIDGRTLVPVRAVSECFGCKVEWDGESQTVIVESNSDNNTDTDVPTPSPTETPVNSVNTIEYNADNEQYASYMKEFKILDAVKNSDGNYDITYTLQTYLEGRGLVVVEFRCLDENGSEVDRFGGAFQGTDYTWSAQEAKTTISGETTRIELVIEK